MQILDVKTTFVPIPPYLDINENPIDLYDKLTAAGHAYNDIIRAGKLNATVFRSEKLGKCQWVNNQSNCTGILKELFEGSIGFSLFPSSYQSYNDKNLFGSLLISSQLTAEQDPVFMSTAHVPEKVADVSPSNVVSQFPLLIVLLNLVVLSLVILIINFRLKFSRHLRIDMLDAIVLHTLRWSRSYKAIHRRIMVFAMLLYCFFSHYFYAGQVRSELILVEPAQFLNSLKEIAQSNRTPSILSQFSLIEDSSHSNDHNRLLILKRATERGALYSSAGSDMMMDSAAGIASGNVGLFEASAFAISIRALLCVPLVMQEDVSKAPDLPKMKITRFGAAGHSGYFFPKNINIRLKKRIETAVSWIVQAGFFHRLYTDPLPQLENAPNVNREKLVYCIDNMHRKKESEEITIVFQLRFMLFFIKTWASGLFFATVAFIVEHKVFKKI